MRKKDAVDLAARQQILPVAKESSFKLVACKKIGKMIAPASPVATYSYPSLKLKTVCTLSFYNHFSTFSNILHCITPQLFQSVRSISYLPLCPL